MATLAGRRVTASFETGTRRTGRAGRGGLRHAQRLARASRICPCGLVRTHDDAAMTRNRRCEKTLAYPARNHGRQAGSGCCARVWPELPCNRPSWRNASERQPAQRERSVAPSAAPIPARPATRTPKIQGSSEQHPGVDGTPGIPHVVGQLSRPTLRPKDDEQCGYPCLFPDNANAVAKL